MSLRGGPSLDGGGEPPWGTLSCSGVVGETLVGESLSKRERRAALNAAVRDLRAAEGGQRRRAVRQLVELGGREALESVVEMLGDEAGEAADEAQVRLPAMEESAGTEALVRALAGLDGLRSKSPMARLRAAETFGRLVGPVDGPKVLARLDRRDEASARALFWSLERLARAGRLLGTDALADRVDQRLRGKLADPVRAAAIQCLSALRPSAPGAQVVGTSGLGQVRGDGPEAEASRLLAVAGLAGVDSAAEARAQAALRTALSAERPGPRALAIDLFGRVRCGRADLEALAARIESEPRPALRRRVVGRLQSLTGWKHRERREAWDHAIARLPEDWIHDPSADPSTGSTRSRGAGRARLEPSSVAALERFEPASDRIAVLVDFSGSLWTKRDDGTCRKELLDPEMDRLLGRLELGSRLWLIPYTAEPHPWTKAPVTMTRQTLAAAKKFFRGARMRGQGNLYGALEVALQDADLDRVLIFTDGAPTGGERWNVDLMIELILERLRFRPVALDFVLLDAPRRLESRWRRLSAQTGGRTLAISTLDSK
ncbi:MAG: hypothetical protein AAGG01_08920 [Planctomycetota bacterium]